VERPFSHPNLCVVVLVEQNGRKRKRRRVSQDFAPLAILARAYRPVRIA
jgi:hypothetical protein